ncbi:MAG: LysE family translocator [Anderseniella sp.]
MTLSLYLTFLGATSLLFLTPGPAMSLVLANSAAHGLRAGFMTVMGNAFGFALLVTIVIAGMVWIVELMANWFEWIKLAGAAYLIWLGVNRIRQGSRLDMPVNTSQSGFFRDGLVVAVANPKVLLFLGAFFPPFINPAGNVNLQFAILGLTFVLCSILSGLLLALAGSRARRFFAGSGAGLIERISGTALVGAGVWLLVSQRS